MYIPPELSLLKEPLAETIELSQARERVKQTDTVIFSKPDTIKQALGQLQNKENIALGNFLKSLPDDILIGMVTVMYIGCEYEGKRIQEEELLYKKYFQSYANWDRNNAISTMVAKATLSKYLQCGMQILF